MRTFAIAPASIVAAFVLVACGTGSIGLKESGTGTERYKKIAIAKYGPTVEYLFNKTRSAVVCLLKSKPTSQRPQNQVSFFVFDLSSDSIIFQDEIVDGSVAWKDDAALLVTTVHGMLKSDESSSAKSGYIFDLRRRKTRSADSSGVE